MSDDPKSQLRNATQAAAAEAAKNYNPSPPSQHPSWKPPGRLGDPQLELVNEPRADAKLLQITAAMGADRNVPPPALAKLNENSSLDEIAAMISEFDDGISALYHGIPLALPEDEDAVEIEREDETIKGGDGQEMLLHVYRPKDQGGKALPCVVYIHGGGMTINTTLNRVHEAWCRSLAAQGLVVIMPDFRNAYTKEAYHHFPAGLNDCVAAVKWISAQRSELKIRNIVLQGESGGGNLACAIALTANREGWVQDIAGVFPLVPYISNAYGWPEERKLRELPSLVENHGYFLNNNSNAFMAYFYTPTAPDNTNPLAWPYHATLEDLKGLPPHVLVMDELDPLRDEGIAYARRLVQAGVDAKGSVNLGVTHGSSLIFRNAVPAFHRDAVRGIAAFAKSL